MADSILTQGGTDNQGTESKTTTPESKEGAVAGGESKIADWRTGLPEDLRGEKMFENIKGKDWAEAGPVLAKGYRDAQKLVGGSLGKLPGKDAKPEEVKAWQDANLPKLREAGLLGAGAPESADKYTATLKLPAGIEANADSVKGFLQTAHKLGLTDAQAQGILDHYVTEFDAGRQALGGSAKETLAALEKDWGGATQRNITMAQRAVAKVGGKELIDTLEQTGLGNHPALIKAFAQMGRLLAEDDPHFADSVSGSESEAKVALAKIMNDMKHPFWNGEDPGHKVAVDEVRRLNEIIHAA